MKTAKRYTFDRSFDAPAKPKAPVAAFTAEDLQAARDAAFIEGEQAGRQAALVSIEQAALDAAGAINQSIAGLFDAEATRREIMKAEAATLARAVAGKIAPRLLAQDPLPDIAALIEDYMALCFNEPRLTVRVAPALVEPLKAITVDMAARQGFAGDVVLLGDAALQGSDCRVEWTDGGVERSEEKLQDEIDRLIADFIAARRRAAGGADHHLAEQTDGE